MLWCLSGDILNLSSDTTAATLTWIFYELATHPQQLKKLQAVIDLIPENDGMIDCRSVANVAELDGVINEALRLHPAVPDTHHLSLKKLANL